MLIVARKGCEVVRALFEAGRRRCKATGSHSEDGVVGEKIKKDSWRNREELDNESFRRIPPSIRGSGPRHMSMWPTIIDQLKTLSLNS